jgi:glycosyltransferase involved in cell wall biosynthesis
MLVPYFAPQSHAAMFRAHKLAKYLPEHGYKPIIVTTDTNYLYNEDPSLLAELSSEVEIHRARYIEPTLRGIRMALGGPDRRFVALKQPTVTSEDVASSTPVNRRPGLGALAAKVIGDWPDRYWTWSNPAFRLASKLVQEHDIRLLYTSANPVSFLRAAIRLKERHRLAWLFDSRDPLGYGQKHSSGGVVASQQEKSILRKSMVQADHVSGLSGAYGQIFFDLYGIEEARWSFIPTGLDEAYLPTSRAAPRGENILHVGEVMANQSSHCFQVLENLLEGAKVSLPFDKLVFVGRREVNEPIIRKMTRNMPNLTARLEFIDHRPQAEVYALMRQAKACMLVPGSMRYWWTNFAKLVDYMALGVPVIAHVPPVSEARHELEKSGTAFFLKGDLVQDTEKLATWLAAPYGSLRSQSGDCYAERYTARRQVADFATLFDRLLSQGK